MLDWVDKEPREVAGSRFDERSSKVNIKESQRDVYTNTLRCTERREGVAHNAP